MRKPSDIGAFVLIGRNGLQTSITLQHLIAAGLIPRKVWLESLSTPMPSLTEHVCRAHQIAYAYAENFNDPGTIHRILEVEPRFMVVAGLGAILKDDILGQLMIANLHIGTLPFYRGAHVNFWKMKAGEDRYGATVHKMEKAIDRGNIYAIREVDLSGVVDGFHLMRKNYQLAAQLLVDWLKPEDRWEQVHPNTALIGQGKYYPKFTDSDLRLDPIQPVTHLYKQINRLRFYGTTQLPVGAQTYFTNRAELLSDEPLPHKPVSFEVIRKDYGILYNPTGLLGLHLTQNV